MSSMLSINIMEELMSVVSEIDDSIETEAAEYEMAEDGPYSMQALRERAAMMGATLQGVEGADILFGSGYTATYAFDDINSLRLSTNALGDVMGSSGPLGGGMAGTSGDDPPVTFAFSRGQLTVRMPEPSPGEAWDGVFTEDEYDVIGDGEIIDEPGWVEDAGDMEDVIDDGEIIDEIRRFDAATVAAARAIRP